MLKPLMAQSAELPCRWPGGGAALAVRQGDAGLTGHVLAQATARKVSVLALCRMARKARRWTSRSPHMTTTGTMLNMMTMKRWACCHGLWVSDRVFDDALVPHTHTHRAWCGEVVCWVLGILTPGWILATMSCCCSRLCAGLNPDCACAVLTWTRGVHCDTADAGATASPQRTSTSADTPVGGWGSGTGAGSAPTASSLWRMRHTAGSMC